MAPRTPDISKKRRRRKKARTEDFSSSSDSDSSKESDHAQTEQDLDGDEDLTDLDTIKPVVEPVIKHVELSKPDPQPIIPEHLKLSTDDKEFEAHYLSLMTSEYGDDLNTLRLSKDFNEHSLPLLISALKSGVNMFDTQERKLILKDLPDNK